MGNDVLDGGADDDRLIGGDGNDTYYFSGDFGADVVGNTSSAYVTDFDEIVFADLTSDQVSLQRSGDDLLISQIDTGNSVRVTRWYVSESSKIDRIVMLGDGATIDAANVNSLVATMAAFAPQTLSTVEMPAALSAAQQNAWSIA